MRFLRLLVWVAALALVAFAAGAVYFRSVSDDPAVWHVDPTAVERTGKPNDALVLPEAGGAADMASPVFPMDAEALALTAHEIIMAEPRVRVVGGGPETDSTTYVQRSKWWGFPDYISVKAVPVEGGAALAIWSRARFGYSDLGVNRARVEDWLAKIEAAVRG